MGVRITIWPEGLDGRPATTPPDARHRACGTNVMLAMVLLDAEGSHDYAVVENTCPSCSCRTCQTRILPFESLGQHVLPDVCCAGLSRYALPPRFLVIFEYGG